MSLEAFYEAIDGDLASVRVRLMTDERITKFVNLFALDPTFENYNAALAEHNVQDAFRAAHTLKGTSKDLGFEGLYPVAFELAELLRSQDESLIDLESDDVKLLTTKLNDQYLKIINNLNIIDIE